MSIQLIFMESSKIKVNSLSGTILSTPFVTKMQTGEHSLISDEPLHVGGQNKGPVAHDFLLAALVSCTCITLKMYAMRKGWEVNEIHVDAEMQRTTESGIQTTGVLLGLSISGNMSDEQKERMVVIAGRCPVHKTLSPAMQIKIEYKS